MALFGRLIQIDISKLNTIGQSFSENHISFNVKKTEFGKEPNPCSVVITNLTETQYSQINTEQKIIVRAGYKEESGLEVLFTGDITYVNPAIIKPETRTTIEAGDAEKSLRQSKVSLAYNSGAQSFQVLRDVIDSFNLPKKTNLNLMEIAKKVYNNGFNFTGSSVTVMNKVCNYLDLIWSIQNEEMKVYKVYNTDRAYAIELNADQGLIGNPQKTKIIETQASENQAKKEIDGWLIECLLQPKAEPGGIVLLTNKKNQIKKYKIVTVQHVGDNFSNDFKTTLQVTEI